jgi:chromosome segregation protein
MLPFKEKTGRLSERLDLIQKETEDKYKEIERLQEEVENARRRIAHLERDLERSYPKRKRNSGRSSVKRRRRFKGFRGSLTQ